MTVVILEYDDDANVDDNVTNADDFYRWWRSMENATDV